MQAIKVDLFFPRSGVTNTPHGGAVICAQVKTLGIPFRSQRTLSAHPSQLGIGVQTVQAIKVDLFHPHCTRSATGSKGAMTNDTAGLQSEDNDSRCVTELHTPT